MNSSITTSAPALAQAAAEHHVDGGERLLLGGRDNDAFAGGETVSLDDDRRAVLADVGLRASAIPEMRVRRRRDIVRRGIAPW